MSQSRHSMTDTGSVRGESSDDSLLQHQEELTEDDPVLSGDVSALARASVDAANASSCSWHVCPRCVGQLAWTPHYNLYLDSDAHGQEHCRKSVHDFMESANSGCNLCAAMCYILAEQLLRRTQSDREYFFGALTPGVEASKLLTPAHFEALGKISSALVHHLHLGPRRQSVTLFVSMTPVLEEGKQSFISFSLEGEVYLSERQAALSAQAVSKHDRTEALAKPNLNVSRPEAWQLAKEWVRRCRSDHIHCGRKGEQSTRPSRVLDVSPSPHVLGNICIVQDHNMDSGEYIT